MRIFFGMKLRSAEIITFEPTRTKVAASPMPIPFQASVVIASVGHIPSTIRNMGFSAHSPFVNSFNAPIT